MTTAPDLRPPVQVALHINREMQPNQQKFSGLVSEDTFGNQLNNGEQNEHNSKHQDITDSEKKVILFLIHSPSIHLKKVGCKNIHVRNKLILLNGQEGERNN